MTVRWRGIREIYKITRWACQTLVVFLPRGEKERGRDSRKKNVLIAASPCFFFLVISKLVTMAKHVLSLSLE